MKNEQMPKGLDLIKLRDAISEEYSEVANAPHLGFHFHTGRPLAQMLTYEEAWLAAAPESSIESFAGTGNPFLLGEIKPGQRVVDVGSGAGMDSLIAAYMVGETGHVTGVDMTEAMLAKARASAVASGATNIEFVKGHAEELPVADESVDVVISNGVFNLVPAKASALREMFRVLKPGGRIQIADILLESEVPAAAKGVVDLWTGCIAGGLLEAELTELVEGAGFINFEIIWREDVFTGAPQESSATAFGTKGITFRATKPAR